MVAPPLITNNFAKYFWFAYGLHFGWGWGGLPTLRYQQRNFIALDLLFVFDWGTVYLFWSCCYFTFVSCCVASVISSNITAAWTWREALVSTTVPAASLHPRHPRDWSTDPLQPAAASEAALHQIPTVSRRAFRFLRMCCHCCTHLLCAFSKKNSSCGCRWVPGATHARK